MSAPVVSWYDESNQVQQTQWAVGTVDAGSVGDDATFLIWNNRGGSEAVSDMENCSITTKDDEGGDTGELVNETWVEVKVETLGEPNFTPVGGSSNRHPIGNGITPQVISGAANNGTIAGAPANHCKIVAHVNVPSTATAGKVDFLFRVSYTYV